MELQLVQLDRIFLRSVQLYTGLSLPTLCNDAHKLMTHKQEQFLLHFEPLRERLWRFIRAMVFRWDTNEADFAQEIMSETILQLLESFDEVRDRQAFLSYCFTIAHRTHKTMLRKRSRWNELAPLAEDQLHSSEASPETHTDIRALYEALDQLPEKVKEAVILFELSDLSLESIQEIQGGTLSGVKSRVSRGRAELARILRVHADPVQSSIDSSGILQLL